jgi:hypothetical protein
MGVVFFLGFLIVLFFVGLACLFLFLAFLLLGLIGGHKRKKMYFFLIPAGIFFLLGAAGTIAPFPFFAGVKQMNTETVPTIGKYIDQDVYQSSTFSVDGTTYDALSGYHSLLGVEGHKDVTYTYFCTYRSWFFFLHLNSGYYYRLEDPSLDYSLVTDDRNSVFTKREDYDRVLRLYRDGPTHWWSSRSGKKLNAEAEKVDMEAVKQSQSVALSYADYGEKMIDLTFISDDGYVRKDYIRVFKASDEMYYLRLNWLANAQGAIDQIESVKLPSAFQDALKLDETYVSVSSGSLL